MITHRTVREAKNKLIGAPRTNGGGFSPSSYSLNNSSVITNKGSIFSGFDNPELRKTSADGRTRASELCVCRPSNVFFFEFAKVVFRIR
jgi:hypothetical protein